MPKLGISEYEIVKKLPKRGLKTFFEPILGFYTKRVPTIRDPHIL